MATFHSKWAIDPVDLSNNLNHASWADHEVMEIKNGKVLFKNDATYLYVAFDMINDMVNDPVPAPADGDYFWMVFDRDRSNAVSSGIDVLYSPYKTNANKLGRAFVLSTSSTTGMTEQMDSQCRAAFEASPYNPTAHKIFKLRLKISDLNTGITPFPFFLAPYTKFGLRYHSTTPNLLIESPANVLANFAGFHKLYFALKPSVPLADLGPVIGSVGLIPTTKINSVTGRATTAAGYYVNAVNAAFGGTLNIIGNRTKLQQLDTAHATKYKVLHRFGTSDPFTIFRSAWSNYKWTGTDYTLESFGPDAAGFYPMPDMGADYSIDDLLVQINSSGLPTGIHQFQVEFYNGTGGAVSTGVPVQTLTLYIDNAVPQVMINSIKHAGVNVNKCAIVNLSSATDGISFNITAYDPEGNLNGYTLSAGWGNGEGEVIKTESYSGSGNWQGVQNLNVAAPPSVWVPHETCAHGFTISATARVTNGYGYIGYNSYTQYLTLIKP